MRRLIDLLVAITALAALLPLFLLVALAIRIDSPGPVFYLAPRCGLHGRRFRMWKFRSMISNAAAGSAITGRKDSRITRAGALLRVSKFDELPQFINLLLGDVTLVGPRPETPSMVARYNPEQREVLSVKPGITGPQQLLGEESEGIPAGADPEQYYAEHLLGPKIQADLQYIRTRTPASDAAIVAGTVRYIFRALVASAGRSWQVA